MRESGDTRSGSWKKYEQDATGNLSRVLAVDNDNVEAYVIFALIYMEGSERNKSRLDLANLLLDEGAKRNDSFAPLWNARGLLQLRKDNVGRALSMFEKAVSLDPKFAEARMNAGNIVLGFRKYDVAKQQFEAVLELKPKNYDAMVGLGIAQRGMGDLEAAEASYKKAQKLNPRGGPAVYNLGLLHKDFYASRAGDENATMAEYKKAKTYFTQFLSKADVDKRDKKDAEDHIEDCDKAVSQLQEAIRIKSQAEAAGAAGAGGTP
jgi:tetratricopeptide (TPR) repeat protein